ncbi:MAG: hypothetical protein GDA36_01335 [Rhodobacteraceae bacterium]|nr:hypothetical protein [Paracoccaceae bacterium]
MIFWPGVPSDWVSRAEVAIIDVTLVQSTTRPSNHFSADTKARWVRKGLNATPGYKIKSNGFARPDDERFIDATPRLQTGTPCASANAA